MRSMKWMGLLIAFALMGSLTACEKMILDEDAETAKEQEGNVVIRANMFNIVPFNDTRAVQDVADFCTRLCFVVYQEGATKKKVLQKIGDEGFGRVKVYLEPGTYQLMVLGHSSSGNPSLADPEFLQFTNADGFSDTFYYYGDLVVGNELQDYDIALQRATSMVRITITDAVPAEAKRIHLVYKGESGVLNAVTGWGGTVNSQQSVFYDIANATAPLVLEAYTFLREETGSLNITITAHNAYEDIIAEKQLDNVPMKNHMVTEYYGHLFSASDNESAFGFQAETDWEIYGSYNF